VIYLDSSVVLARVFAEPRSPPDAFWSQVLVSSQLLEYEVFTRVNARKSDALQRMQARHLVDRVTLSDLGQQELARALRAFPIPVRTLDGLHLATMDYLRAAGQRLELATYDQRLSAAAGSMGFTLARL
jgi:hypothetical protein